MLRAESIALLLLTSLPTFGQPQTSDNRWAPLAFLIGEWTGVGGGGPGQGTGGFSFLPDQDGKILVRKNHSDYPATKDRPRSSHTDLMIIYREAGEAKPRAIYFDDEDHVIHYTVEVLGGGESVQFLSDVSSASPRYRLTYRKTGEGSVAIRFEIAPADKPEAFAVYIEASARREAR